MLPSLYKASHRSEAGVKRVESGVEVEVYVHATESQEKVLDAVRNCMPTGMLQTLRSDLMTVEGHFGNPIVIVTLTGNGADPTLRLLRHIAERLTSAEREHVSRNLDQYIDEKGAFSIRLDKQRAYTDVVALGPSDAILIKARERRGGMKSSEAVRSLLEQAGFTT